MKYSVAAKRVGEEGITVVIMKMSVNAKARKLMLNEVLGRCKEGRGRGLGD